MSLQDELTQTMVDGYRRAGEEVGYWGKRYLQAIRRGGGLATAKRMLSRKQNVPFFFRQWGGVRKDLTGRLLRGRTYDEMPVRVAA